MSRRLFDLMALLRRSKRRLVQTTALLLSNAYLFSAFSFVPCGYLQCSNCALSTFACPLILIQRGAVFAAMGMFGMMGDRIIASIGSALAMLVLFGALFGSWGCGWLCPFGFLQDLLAKIPLPKFHLPGWSGALRLPLFLLLLVLLPYLSRSLLFCDLCPPGAINRLWQQAWGIPLFFKTPEGAMAVVSLFLLGGILLLALFVHRPFCALLCPIGGIHGLFNRISGLHLRVEAGCSDCGRCRRACPQGINPAATPAHAQCSRCLSCTNVCPHLKLDLRL